MVEIMSTVIINVVTNFLTLVILYELSNNINKKREGREYKNRMRIIFSC